jgi:protocatechuate 3,4-dioxygenase beta subunit
LIGTDSYGNPIEEITVTDENGEYQFIVPPGDYTITVTPPAGTVPSGSESDDPTAVLVDSVTTQVTVGSTDVNDNNDFLNYTPIDISGSVQDEHDGLLTTTDNNQPINGVTVALYTDPNQDGDVSDGEIVATTTTDENGNYLFEDQKPGSYIIMETDPVEMVSIAEITGTGALDSDYPDGAGTDENNNQIPLITVSGIDSEDNLFLDSTPVIISGTVKDDEDFDGDATDDDAGIPGVTVTLYADPDGDGNPDGEPIQTVVTNENGEFIFNDVTPGLYVVVENDPMNYSSTADGSLLVIDSVNDNRIPVIVFSGIDQEDLYFLDTKPYAILMGQVQMDTDNDGDVNDPDNGINNVTVELWTDPNGNGTPDDGEKVAETQTDEQGNYQFEDIVTGNYLIITQDNPGYSSTGDLDQGEDNIIPIVVSIDEEQHCQLPSALRSSQLASCTSLDFVDRQLTTEISMSKTVYAGYDSGAKCGTDAARDEITLVDIDKDLQEPATYCFEITNTGENYLTDIELIDNTLGLTSADLTALTAVPSVLKPISEDADAKVVYYYEKSVTETIVNTATAQAKPAKADGTLLDGFVGGNDTSKATVYLVFDPPSALKTVTPEGQAAMQWQMVWINSAPAGTQAKVTVYDEVPEGTHFAAMQADTHVSADGVYCEARGQSVTESCIFEPASTQYPRGRVVWTGYIHGDGSATTELDASHEVVIRFLSVLDNPAKDQVITNQAHSSWDMDDDGVPEFEDVTTKAPGGDNPNGSTEIKVGQPFHIPTMSFWGLMLMALMLALVGRRRFKG